MNTYTAWGVSGKVIRFMFTNYSNVKWFIDGIYIKTLPISKKDRIIKFFKDKTIYQYLIPPIRDKSCIIWQQWLPMELWWNESKEIYMDYYLHLNWLNEDLQERKLLLKSYIFVDSLWKKYEFKVNKKWFEEFITTKKQLLESENS
jgi:hypothetical protein